MYGKTIKNICFYIIIILLIFTFFSFGDQKEKAKKLERTIAQVDLTSIETVLNIVGPKDRSILFIIKYDDNKPIKNSEIELYNEHGSYLSTATSNKDGYFGFSGMENGEYYAKLSYIPNGYDINEKIIYLFQIDDTNRYFEKEITCVKNEEYKFDKNNLYDDFFKELSIREQFDQRYTMKKLSEYENIKNSNETGFKLEQVESKKEYKNTNESSYKIVYEDNYASTYIKFKIPELKDLSIEVTYGDKSASAEDYEKDKIGKDEKYINADSSNYPSEFMKLSINIPGATIVSHNINEGGIDYNNYSITNKKQYIRSKFNKNDEIFIFFDDEVSVGNYLDIETKFDYNGKRYNVRYLCPIQNYGTGNSATIEVQESKTAFNEDVIYEVYDENNILVKTYKKKSETNHFVLLDMEPGKNKIVKKVNNKIVAEQDVILGKNQFININM